MSGQAPTNDLFFERVVLKLLLKNQEIRDIVLPHITESVFDNPPHKQLVKIIIDFVSKYGKFPTYKDIKLDIESNDLKESLDNILGIDESEYTQDSLLDHVANFMRRKLLWVEMVKWVELMKSKKGLDTVDVDKVLQAKNFSFKNNVGMDVLKDDGKSLYQDIHRKDVYVKTGYSGFDDIMAGGFYKQAMTLFVAGTNCFDGEEEILVFDERKKHAKRLKLSYLFEFFKEWTYWVKTPTGEFTVIRSVVKKENVSKIKVTFSDGHSRIVAETHRFMEVDGSEVYAKDASRIKTTSGLLDIVSKEPVTPGDVYDIQIDAPHWYQDQYGVIHHNTGKTLFKCSFAKQCLERDQNVLFLTLEMPESKIRDRIVCNLMDKSKSDLMKMSESELIQRYSAMKKRLKQRLIIKEYGEHELTASKLQVYLKELDEKLKFKPDIVFLDYLGLVSANVVTRDANGASQLKRASEEFHAVAKKFNFALVSSMQFNRQGFKSKDPNMDDISESFATLFTADEVLLINQTSEMHASRRYNYKKVKSRTPGKGLSGNFFVDYDKMRLFEDHDATGGTDERVEAEMDNMQKLIERKAQEIEETGEFHLTPDEIEGTMGEGLGGFDLEVDI